MEDRRHRGKCLDQALSASGASLRGAWRSKYSCRVAKALRDVWRTAVEGDARFADSKSEIEFTNGIGGWMMRCGKALARPSSKYCAALTAKALVGHAHGPGESIRYRRERPRDGIDILFGGAERNDRKIAVAGDLNIEIRTIAAAIDE